jgi:hypothetical protein
VAKKNRQRTQPTPRAEGEVGPRQPCPCGSGKRYKACHGSGEDVFVPRPFEGLASECDVVAMRELVPAATAPLTLSGEYAGKSVLLCTLLPGAAPALVRESGEIWLGLQVQHGFGDPARDLGAVLELALAADEPGAIGLTQPPGPGARLQDLLDPQAPIEVTVHEGFDYWIADLPDTEGVEDALEQANSGVAATARLAGVSAAYWTDAGSKEHLRWVMPEPEGELLDALARLHAAGEDRLIDGTRFIGMFRTQGLLVPVWDVPLGTGAEALESPAIELKKRLDDALARSGDLTPEERSARAGLATRQVTIR